MAPIAGRTTTVLRVTHFRPREAWAAIDPTLRAEGIPAFLAQPGLVDAWFGRRGPEFHDEHVIASVWASASAERAGQSVPPAIAEHASAEASSGIALPIVLDLRFPRALPPAILRIYDGRTHPGQLDAYVEEAAQGVLLDGARPDGPVAVCMSVDRPDRFITASVWTGWDSIAACTGGDVGRPLITRSRERLAGGGPTHYELITPL